MAASSSSPGRSREAGGRRPRGAGRHHYHHHRHGRVGGLAPPQAWSILERHARDDVRPVRLRELCRDGDRASALVAVHSSAASTSRAPGDDDGLVQGEVSRILVADMSRQLMTLETLNHLFKLGESVGLRQFIARLSWGGQNDPRNPVVPARVARDREKRQQHPKSQPPPPPLRGTPHRPLPHHRRAASTGSSNQQAGRFLEMEESQERSGKERKTTFYKSEGGDETARGPPPPSSSMHVALRVPPNLGHEMYDRAGESVLGGIHRDWDRVERLSSSYRIGQLRGASGAAIRTVLVVGRGVPVEALRFVDGALRRDQRAAAASRFGMGGPDGIGIGGINNPAAALATKLRRNLAGMGGVMASMGGGSATGAADPHPAHPRDADPSHPRHHSLASAGPFGGATAAHARRIKFLSSIDPVEIASVLSSLDPASTLVVSVALAGDEETGLATRLAKAWLLQSLSSSRHQSHGGGGAGRAPADYVLQRHMALVTGSDRVAAAINRPGSVHVVPEHCRSEPFSSCTAAVVLPLAIVYGWGTAREFLDGAHDLDAHFATAHARNNLPVLLALCDVWNDAFLGASARVVTPFAAAFSSYPTFVASLEAQACTLPAGNASAAAGASPCPSLVVDGGTSSAVDRALYQSGQFLSSELVATFDGQVAFNAGAASAGPSGGGAGPFHDAAAASHDALVCSLFAHADELALGSRADAADGDAASDVKSAASSPKHQDGASPEDGSDGNRPSLVLLTGKVDAFVCGQLVALAEHRAAVKAHVWGLDPFVARCGASLRLSRTEQLKEALRDIRQGAADEDEDEGGPGGSDGRLILSTKTLLRHYSNFARDLR